MKLTPKQQKFADYYIQNGGNATDAAIRAGYSKKTAAEMGYENMKKPHVQQYVAQINKEIKNDRIADMIEVKEFWTKMMRDDKADKRDRIKASELIGKTNGAFLEKIESKNEHEIIVKLEGESFEWSK